MERAQPWGYRLSEQPQPEATMKATSAWLCRTQGYPETAEGSHDQYQTLKYRMGRELSWRDQAFREQYQPSSLAQAPPSNVCSILHPHFVPLFPQSQLGAPQPVPYRSSPTEGPQLVVETKCMRQCRRPLAADSTNASERLDYAALKRLSVLFPSERLRARSQNSIIPRMSDPSTLCHQLAAPCIRCSSTIIRP